MQWPPTKASRPSMTTSLRWSRSFRTPMLRELARMEERHLAAGLAHRLARRPCRSSCSRSRRAARAPARRRARARRARGHAPAELRLPSTGRSRSAPTSRAADRASSSASKNAPFSRISTALPATGVLSVSPASDGIELLDRRRAFDPQRRIAVAPDRPDDDRQQDQQGREHGDHADARQRDEKGRTHRRVSRSATRSHRREVSPRSGVSPRSPRRRRAMLSGSAGASPSLPTPA